MADKKRISGCGDDEYLALYWELFDQIDAFRMMRDRPVSLSNEAVVIEEISLVSYKLLQWLKKEDKNG